VTSPTKNGINQKSCRFKKGSRQMPREKKSFKGMAEELKALRRRPIPQEEVDRFNKTQELGILVNRLEEKLYISRRINGFLWLLSAVLLVMVAL